MQGPKSAEILKTIGIEPNCPDSLTLCDITWNGGELSVTRMMNDQYLTYEIWLAPENAAALWDATAGLRDAEGDERRRHGAHEVGKGSRSPEARCHVRGKDEDCRADGDVEDCGGESARADDPAQGGGGFCHTAAAINSENFSRSILPPETMATIGP